MAVLLQRAGGMFSEGQGAPRAMAKDGTAAEAAMAADCGLITGLSYGCQRCSSCEQPGSQSLRPPPRRAPAKRAGASRALTGAPQDLQKVRYAPSNPPYRPISSPIRPVLCPSDTSTAAFPPWQVD